MPRKRTRAQPGSVATAEEVLETFTRIMRGEITEDTVKHVAGGEDVITSQMPKIAERHKAAEMLGKRYGLFSDRPEDDVPGRAEVIGQIEEAMQRLKEEHRGD